MIALESGVVILPVLSLRVKYDFHTIGCSKAAASRPLAAFLFSRGSLT